MSTDDRDKLAGEILVSMHINTDKYDNPASMAIKAFEAANALYNLANKG